MQRIHDAPILTVMDTAPAKDNFSTDGYDRARTGTFTDSSAKDLLAYKRGLDWLRGEIPSLQDFARAWSGKNITVRPGPFPCTDGKVIYLAPPKLEEGMDEPDRKYMGLLYHELAHCVITDTYDPPNAKPIPQNAVKYIADKEYGQPAGWVWNAIEDGRVEEWLYTEAPGARKHILTAIQSVTDQTIESLNNPQPPRTPEQAADIGLLLAAYYKSAGHDGIVEKFPERVRKAIDDREIRDLIKRTHKMKTSKQVLTDLVAPFMKRARELGFFADADPRSMDPETGQPQNVDWNDLSDAEKEELRQQIRDAMRGKEQPKPQPGQEVKGVEIPEEEIQQALDELDDEERKAAEERMREEAEAGSPQRQDPKQHAEDGEEGQQGTEAEGSEEGESEEQQGAGAEGSEEGESEEQGAQGQQAGSADANESGETDTEGDQADSVEGPVSAESGGHDAEITQHEQIEQAAKDLHDQNEQARLERWKDFAKDFEEIEDTMRPPHREIRDKSEVPYEEKSSPEAQLIEKADKLEVGHIWGSERHDFVFNERKVTGPGNREGRETLNEFADTIAGTVNRLRAIFKQNKKSAFGGRYEIGQHINQRALTGFVMKEHLKPFDRRSIPKKYNYAVTLLIDQSGSMAQGYSRSSYAYYGSSRAMPGSKIVMARTAVAMQAEMLAKLQIPFEVLGFTTGGSDTGIEHSVFKSFDESWNVDTINRVLAIEAKNSNLDGLALAWAWDRLKVRKEQVKILITYSDGQPAPDTDNQTRIMKHVLRKIAAIGAIAIGVGIQSTSVDRLYPKVVHCNDLRELPKQMVELLERELKNK